MTGLVALADEVAGSVDISGALSSMATAVQNNIGPALTAVVPIIGAIVGINFAVRFFKKNAK